MVSRSVLATALLAVVLAVSPALAGRHLLNTIIDKFEHKVGEKVGHLKEAVDHMKQKTHGKGSGYFVAAQPNYIITQQPQYVVAAMPQLLPQPAPVVAAAAQPAPAPAPVPVPVEVPVKVYKPEVKPFIVPLPIPVPKPMAMKHFKLKGAGHVMKAVAKAVLENTADELGHEYEHDDATPTAPDMPITPAALPVPSAPADDVFAPTPVPVPTPVPTPVPVPTLVPTPVPVPSAPAPQLQQPNPSAPPMQPLAANPSAPAVATAGPMPPTVGSTIIAGQAQVVGGQPMIAQQMQPQPQAQMQMQAIPMAQVNGAPMNVVASAAASAGPVTIPTFQPMQVVAVQNQVNSRGMVTSQAYGVVPAGAQVVLQAGK